MDLPDVFETDVARAEEGWHQVVLEAAQVKADTVVKESHSDAVELFRYQAYLLELAGSFDLLDDAAFDVVW